MSAKSPTSPPHAREEPEQASEDSIPAEPNTDNRWQTEPLERGKSDAGDDTRQEATPGKGENAAGFVKPRPS